LMLPTLAAQSFLPLRSHYFDERIRSRRFLADVMHGIARLRMLAADGAALCRWQYAHCRELDMERQLGTHDTVQHVLDDAWPWLACSIWVLVLVSVLQANTALVLAGTLLLWPAMTSALALGRAGAAWMQARTFVRHTEGITQAPLDAAGSAPASAPSPLVFDQVSFHYPGTRQPVLQAVSLRIEPGQLVVFAGPSGGGKSTLLRLLLGFDAPLSGRILHGNAPLQDLDMARWRQSIGAVMQDERVATASTLRSQISGLAPCDVDEVWRVAELARLADDIRAMPMGMQTIVESNKISTGQEQRLLIASRLLRQPSLLLLDEATNAIPEQAQAELLGNLRAAGITCILVTHRESAIALADQVYVLEGGRIVWNGAPAALEAQTRLKAMMRAEQTTAGRVT
ncbi:MAG: ATP-binding cassette domain-containing protein, partial [Burkholderiales bacterium]